VGIKNGRAKIFAINRRLKTKNITKHKTVKHL
jgi:hypothetical protein